MACVSSSERNRRVGTTLANASLLPELQTPPTSKSRFQHWPRHGSSCPLFAGSGEPAKRSFSRRTLRLTEKEWLYRRRALTHADAASHVPALVSCSRS